MKRKYFKKFLQFFFFNFFFCYLRMIPAVPKRQAAVKSHRNNRSSTIAMNFQSSITCKIIRFWNLIWYEVKTIFCLLGRASVNTMERLGECYQLQPDTLNTVSGCYWQHSCNLSTVSELLIKGSIVGTKR